MVSNLSLDLQQQIEIGASILKRGGVIAYPTDTVYGLGAGASFTEAVERIYEIKERPRHMPFPLLLADISQITTVAGSVPQVAWCLIRNFLPGALTLVLPAASSLPDALTANRRTVALRIPAHPVPLGLVERLGMPIIGTSANISGRPSPLTAEEVRSQLGDRVDFIIDGGRCPGGKESTIVDVTGDKPLILRAGAIPGGKLRQACGSIVIKEGD